MTVPDDLARIYASAPTDDSYIETIELAHPLFSQTWYLTTEPYAFAGSLEDGTAVSFEPFPFSVQLPGQSGQGQQDLVLAVDNVDRSILDELERANADPTQLITATYRVFTRSDPAAPALVLPALAIADVAATATQISGTASRTDVLNRPFPASIYTVEQFPGLDR